MRIDALRWCLAAMLLPLVIPTAAIGSHDGDEPHRLSIVDRSIVQGQRHEDPQRVPAGKLPRPLAVFWQVDYRLRHEGPTNLVVTPTEVAATVQGWVSNSRVASHAAPKFSSVPVSADTGPGLVATATVIASDDAKQRCREAAIVQVWTDAQHPDGPPEPIVVDDAQDEPPFVVALPDALDLPPGATVRVRLRLEHLHDLYGAYDPLLGQRELVLTLGAATFRDRLPLDGEHYVAHAHATWPEPPEEYVDTRFFVTPQASLHLQAHVPNLHQYRFPERPVRYATRMRLRYWYLIAPGTQGTCRIRVSQYRHTPAVWKLLSEGVFEEVLTTVGRWTLVEHVFRTEPEASTLVLDVRITGSDIGELWIDDVVLEPVNAGPTEP